MSDCFKNDVFKLGFGLMRLPKLADGKTIDVEQTKTMVDLFIAAGGTYFDTAYVYDAGESEAAIRKALVDRYPRESYTLCTKLCAWMQCEDEASAKQQFYTSLERTGAGYFDYYLLHAFQLGNYKKYDEYRLWDFMKELKEKGLIRRYGFSFHATPALLDELLTAHPEVDFVQLQINYADWENPGVASGGCYEVARKHGKPIVVMEPIKGGALADPIPAIKAVFDATGSNRSYASWAVRFAASLDGVAVTLSGMSNVAQMEDNLSYMKDFKPLSEEERAVIRKAQESLDADKSIPCTSCHYCVKGCPMQIPIPEIFLVKNRATIYPSWDGGKSDYVVATHGQGRASDCVECGQCESACPQQLKVISLLKSCLDLEQ